MLNNRVLTVTQLNEYVRGMLSYDPILSALRLEGEISNVRQTASGHIYFVLKDEEASIEGVLFEQYAVDVNIADGMNVIVEGYVSLYPTQGRYQLYAQGIEKKGYGELYTQWQESKEKLMRLGYFDETQKKEIPSMPRRIGVVTSSTGAVLHDIEQVVARRCPLIPIICVPSAVQGEEAPKQIVAGIEKLNRIKDVDVIIVARGGGSFEDLGAFNTEEVAVAIFESCVPIISAVGHETDITMADFVADLRAPTPSVGAELATPANLPWELQDLKQRLHQTQRKFFQKAKDELKQGYVQLHSSSLRYKIESEKYFLAEMKQKMYRAWRSSLLRKQWALQSLAEQLQWVDPEKERKKGYALLQQNGKLIYSMEELDMDQRLDVLLPDGILQVQIVKKEKKHVE